MRVSMDILRSNRAKALLIIVLVVLLAIFTWIAPPHEVVLHNILHHMNILPFLLAGMFFGWKGAIRTIFLAVVLQTPSIYRHWHSVPLDAQDQIVELSTFGAAGIIAGILADRGRMERERLKITKRELEHVYAELQQNIEQLKQTERLTVAGRLSASLAHEIRNPLASISGAAGILARKQASAASQAECLDILMVESQRLNKLLTNFLDFARPRLLRLQWIDPVEMLQSVTALAQHASDPRGVTITLDLPAHLPEIECDPEQIKQLLLNLILNAIQATEGAGSVLIRASISSLRLVVEVCDHGHGILPEDLDRIFDPFFTTKDNGTGLGLAIAANIAAQHGGVLTCAPNPPRGTIFRMELPIRHMPAEASILRERTSTL